MSHSPSKVRRALVGAGTIAVVLGIVYVVLRMGPLAATQVTVQRVERGVLTPSVSGIGTVEARQSWLLGPTQAGRVLKVHVDVGQAVAAGTSRPGAGPSGPRRGSSSPVSNCR